MKRAIALHPAIDVEVLAQTKHKGVIQTIAVLGVAPGDFRLVDALTLVFDDGLATADRSPGKHTFALQSGAAHHDARAAMERITHRRISHGYATHGYANTDCRQIRL